MVRSVTEANNPVDVGSEVVRQYQKDVVHQITHYNFGGRTQSLPELIRSIEPEEDQVMTDAERGTYLALREGMQVFYAVTTLVNGKIGFNARLQEVGSQGAEAIINDPRLNEMRDFVHTYAAFAASKYVSRKLAEVIAKEGGVESPGKPDFSPFQLRAREPSKESVLRYMLVPVYGNLIEHGAGGDEAKTGEVFKTPLEFPVYVKDLFDHYAELALQKRDSHPEFSGHIEGHQFRIMDDTIILDGYNDISAPHEITGGEEMQSFRRIESKDIVGNKYAKIQIVRTVERLMLYDALEERNPVLELGGVPWSVLFDGLPGTGKSSLFRLVMTRGSDLSEITGLPYGFFLVDSSIKKSFYGDTGKALLERLGLAKDRKRATSGILDDLDMLTTSREHAQGADNDISSILMQYLDGVMTERLGNVVNFVASNDPAGLDAALRNRANARFLIDGPRTPEDMADMVFIVAPDHIEKGIIQIETGYEPFATQAEHVDSSGEAAYMAEEFAQYRDATVLDFGKFVAGLKKQNERITGRSMNAIMEAVKGRSADFDIPAEWFEDRPVFLDQPYARKVLMLQDLYKPITPDVLFQEAQRYFDSEQRYAETEHEAAVERQVKHLEATTQARILWLEDGLHKEGSDLQRVSELDALHNLHVSLTRERALAVAKKSEGAPPGE